MITTTSVRNKTEIVDRVQTTISEFFGMNMDCRHHTPFVRLHIHTKYAQDRNVFQWRRYNAPLWSEYSIPVNGAMLTLGTLHVMALIVPDTRK